MWRQIAFQNNAIWNSPLFVWKAMQILKYSMVVSLGLFFTLWVNVGHGFVRQRKMVNSGWQRYDAVWLFQFHICPTLALQYRDILKFYLRLLSFQFFLTVARWALSVRMTRKEWKRKLLSGKMFMESVSTEFSLSPPITCQLLHPTIQTFTARQHLVKIQHSSFQTIFCRLISFCLHS